MNKVCFITLNSFGTLPPVKQLLLHLKESHKIHCIQCVVEGYDNFFNDQNIDQNFVLRFSSSKTFFNQSFIQKLTKYLRLSFFAFRQKLRWRNHFTTFFAIDIFSLVISLLAKSKKHKVVYIQYEVIEPKRLNKLDRLLFKLLQRYSDQINLIITPEENRTKFLMSLFKKSDKDSFFTLPNTNNNQIDLSQVKKPETGFNHPIVITHIGAVGLKHHIKSFLSAVSKLKEDKYEVRFIGLLTQDVQDLINEYNCSFIKIIGQVKHSELKKYYLETDIGVILYKDVSINHRFCAPNKLYEYWSYGIPVLGDNLPGLNSIFHDSILGKLADLSKPEEIRQSIELMSETKADKQAVQDYFYNHFSLNNYLLKLNKKLIE